MTMAADAIAWLATEARRRRLTGVALKDARELPEGAAIAARALPDEGG